LRHPEHLAPAAPHDRGVFENRRTIENIQAKTHGVYLIHKIIKANKKACPGKAGQREGGEKKEQQSLSLGYWGQWHPNLLGCGVGPYPEQN